MFSSQSELVYAFSDKHATVWLTNRRFWQNSAAAIPEYYHRNAPLPTALRHLEVINTNWNHRWVTDQLPCPHMDNLQEVDMSRMTYPAALAAIVLAFGASVPALADECTETITKVEEAAASAQLGEQDKVAIMGMVNDARAKQTAGDTQGCTMTLAAAKAALQIE